MTARKGMALRPAETGTSLLGMIPSPSHAAARLNRLAPCAPAPEALLTPRIRANGAEGLRNYADIVAQRPASVPPELDSFRVSVKDETVALVDACCSQNFQALVSQLSGDALATPARMHRKMVDGSAPAVVPAENRADEGVPVQGDEAHARIPFEVRLNPLL